MTAGPGTVRGIIFSAAMVKALIAGRKTETRRLATNRNVGRVEPGDLLWVREAFRLEIGFDGIAPNVLLATSFTEMPVWYEADCGAPDPKMSKSQWGHPWGRLRPSIHMPKWASRLSLDVVEVRREKLQAISEASAQAEGLERIAGGGGAVLWRGARDLQGRVSARAAFADLWDSLNSFAGARWADNPDIITIKFSVSERNIVEIEKRRAA